MNRFVASFSLVVAVSGHSWITRPTAHNAHGGRGNLVGPCDAFKGGRYVTNVAAGSKINFAWPPMGHAGGYLRFALAPQIGQTSNGVGTAADQAALDLGVIQTSCYGGGACGTCVNNRPFGGQTPGIKPYNVDVKIPSNIQDGLYTMQAYLYGTGNGLPDYYSCSDLKIFGGDANEECTVVSPAPMETCWHCTQQTCDPARSKHGDLSQSQNTKWCFTPLDAEAVEVHRKATDMYCGNRPCIAGKNCPGAPDHPESTKQGNLNSCAASVKANPNCGNSFSYGGGWCECAPKGEDCEQTAFKNYHVYEFTAKPVVDDGGGDGGGDDGDIKPINPIVIVDGDLQIIVDNPCLNDYAAVSGDTLYLIAQRYGTTVEHILQASGTEDDVYCADFAVDECPRQCDARGSDCTPTNGCAWQCTGTKTCRGFLEDCVEIGHEFIVPSADCYGADAQEDEPAADASNPLAITAGAIISLIISTM